MWPIKGDPGYRTGNAPMGPGTMGPGPMGPGPMGPGSMGPGPMGPGPMGPGPMGPGGPMAPWHLNPAAYQNMSNEQVDWARLAQQWIMMKDTLPPQAPPPPQLSVPKQPAPPGSTILEEEGGEAPMDISKDEHNDLESGGEPVAWNGNNSWQQQCHPPPWNSRSGGYWSHKSEGSRFPHPPNAPNFDYNRGYPGPGFDGMPPGPPQMPPFVRPRHQWEGKNMKIDRRFQNAAHNPPPAVVEEEPVLDAAKRRTLPPWIREGLEKMEREKLKREEREKAEQERDEANRRRLLDERDTQSDQDAEKPGYPMSSKFDTDSEAGSEAFEDLEEKKEVINHQPVVEAAPRPRRRFHDGPLPEVVKKPLWVEKPSISREDLMLKVRRTMTEVLLDVTNSEIESVVEETMRKALSKASAKHQPAKNNVALASSKASLGLAMYGSGSEGSSSESEDDVDLSKGKSTKGRDSGEDSDVELKEIIRQRQQDFVVKEKEIEAAVAEAEEREQRAAAKMAKSGAESAESAKELSNNGQAVRQVESNKELSHADEPNGKSAKVEKTERKQRSPSRSLSSTSSSSDSSRGSRHRKRKKEKRSRHRSRDRKKDRKRRRSSSSSRRSKSPRRKHSSRDRERKRRGSRDRSRSRNRRRRSRSSESHRKSSRRSRSRSDSSRRRKRHRSTSSSSSSDRRSRKRR